MMKKNICILIVLLILLSSCNKQVGKHNLISSDIAPTIEPPIEETTVTETIHEIIAPNITSNTITEPLTTVEPNEISVLTIYPFGDNSRSWIFNAFYNLDFPYYNEFEGLVSKDEFKNWWDNYHPEGHGTEEWLSLRMDISEFANLFSFFCDFNFSEQQIRETLLGWNELDYYDGIIDKYIYSKEEINALSTKNKLEVVKLFSNEWATIKDDKAYAPGWFFYSSIEDYKKARITLDDLVKIVGKGGNVIPFYDYFPDLVGYKAYLYLNSDVDVIELCGYDRDFDMPMAYEGYYWSLYESYIDFFNLNRDDDNGFNVIKNETTFSPHWVYYNKPAAYIEAGITPEELIEMLPKYEALGILTDEAWAALQGKIYAYADEG
ncbi:MAG: hypothetical protein FWG70_00010 [Oscillospiraceae bacterium]|nr:hypothetical protein [Oscillospiraceae bacterium]